MNDHDIEVAPELERQVRAELRRLPVPATAPPHVHDHVERLAADALAAPAAPSLLQRLRPRALLIAEVGAAAAFVAVLAVGLALRATSPPVATTPSPTPHPTLDGTPGPTFPPPASGPSSATQGGWIEGLTAYVVVGDRQFRLTTDGGASWSEARSLPAPPDLGLDFFDAQTGYTMWADEVTAGSQLTAYRTTDGGRTWTSTTVGVVPHASDEEVGARIHYADRQHGVVLAISTHQAAAPAEAEATPAPLELRSCRLFTTDDGGAAWSAGIDLPCVGPMVTWQTGLLGYATSACVTCPFAVTENGGRTWTTSMLPGVTSEVEFWPRLMLAEGPGRLRLVGGYVRSGTGEATPRPLVVLSSSDGGATWVEDYRSTTAVDGPSLNSIWSFDAEHWVALEDVPIEERPYQATRLVETWDGGRTWDIVGTSGFTSAGSLSWADRRHGMLQGSDMGDCTDQAQSCGGSGTIFLTNDGGWTWHAVPF